MTATGSRRSSPGLTFRLGHVADGDAGRLADLLDAGGSPRHVRGPTWIVRPDGDAPGASTMLDDCLAHGRGDLAVVLTDRGWSMSDPDTGGMWPRIDRLIAGWTERGVDDPATALALVRQPGVDALGVALRCASAGLPAAMEAIMDEGMARDRLVAQAEPLLVRALGSGKPMAGIVERLAAMAWPAGHGRDARPVSGLPDAIIAADPATAAVAIARVPPELVDGCPTSDRRFAGPDGQTIDGLWATLMRGDRRPPDDGIAIASAALARGIDPMREHWPSRHDDPLPMVAAVGGHPRLAAWLARHGPDPLGHPPDGWDPTVRDVAMLGEVDDPRCRIIAWIWLSRVAPDVRVPPPRAALRADMAWATTVAAARSDEPWAMRLFAACGAGP